MSIVQFFQLPKKYNFGRLSCLRIHPLSITRIEWAVEDDVPLARHCNKSNHGADLNNGYPLLYWYEGCTHPSLSLGRISVTFSGTLEGIARFNSDIGS